MTDSQAYRAFQPDPRADCLCGSGLRFAKCCTSRLPGKKLGNTWRAEALAGHWLAALRHVRADVTQYRIWHESHTVPRHLRLPVYTRAELMRIDIDALSDHVATLMWLHARLGWLGRLPMVLDRLRSAIDDPRWRGKIAYHRGIVALWSGNRAQAAIEIEPLEPITSSCEDVDLLQIHIDLHGWRLGLSERIAFFDAIVARTRSLSDKLQYSGARAFELLLAGDEDGARVTFDAAISRGRAAEAENPLNVAALIWFCKLLEGRAVLDRDAALFGEIVERLGKLVANKDALAPNGIAMVHRAIGDANRYGGRYEVAVAAYRTSYALDPDPALQTFEAECSLHLGDLDEAMRLIRAVPVAGLDEPERADHAFTFFYIALARRDAAELREARGLLRAAETPQPYFEQWRLRHLDTAQQALDALAEELDPPELGPILKAMKAVSRYIQLQPNFIGIGLNINNMIDDLVARADKQGKCGRD